MDYFERNFLELESESETRSRKEEEEDQNTKKVENQEEKFRTTEKRKGVRFFSFSL
jgi:hypothetical protein